ncbi:glycine zipper 2TM domain-containing protein [Sphingopyxis sp.]|uniref:glycine zipper 2TM domain-containing protein n=1 Tax=Sphingopyxis sp. TaxID=1908224 RepID=UPI002B465BCD|nr:glycine zipper 2TM domain-containing protein [Sphingopyxis sp.]HJS11827.1 glycine zipper 2TM domain-containing protein [Sphingopyxis sp.]
MKRIIAAALFAAVAMPVTTAYADPPPWAPAHGKRAKDRAIYDSYGRYYEPRRLSSDDRIWRSRDGQYHCRRDNGTTGLIIGGAVGALVGRELDGGRDRTVGTIAGAAGGALLGRAIDRGELRCR